MGDRDLFFFRGGGGEEDGCSADVVSRLKFRTANFAARNALWRNDRTTGGGRGRAGDERAGGAAAED